MNTSITYNPHVIAEKLGEFESFMEEERARRIPTAAVWTLVVTIALAVVSGIWIAAITYNEVAHLRATLDKWEPKVEQITDVRPLQEEVRRLQGQLEVLEASQHLQGAQPR